MSGRSLFWLRALIAAIVVLLCLPALAGPDRSGDTGVRYWEVKRGDTLFAIGRALAPGDLAEQRQLRAELFELNPTAFENGDSNRLIVGRQLRLPKSGTTPAPSTQPVRAAASKAPMSPELKERKPPKQVARTNSRRAAPRKVSTSLRKVATSEPAPMPKSERAGRVVASRGDAVAIGEDGRTRPLIGRTSVHEGDALVTGPDGYAQIRFRDGALVSLRPHSRFKIDTYHYEGKGDGEAKAFFRLMKGGFRTITGLIGKYNRKAYRVTTPVATIGIRGTHYGLHLCGAGGCARPMAKGASRTLLPGLYGGVVEGAISVRNDGGEELFGINQFFHVSESAVTAKILPEPPGIVFQPEPYPMTEKEGRESRRLPSSGLKAAQTESLPKEKSVSPLEETDETESVALNEPVFTAGETLEGEILTDGEKLLDVTGLQEPNSADSQPEPAPDGAVVTARFIEDLGGGSFKAHGGTVRADGTPANEILINEVNGADNSVVAYSGDDPGFFGGRCTTCGFDADNASLKDVGGIAGSGIGINWGRWKGGYEVTENGLPLATTGDLLSIYSPNISSDSAIANQTGTAMFSYAGGPPPRDEMGRAGQVLSADVGVDFDAQAVTSYDLILETPDGAGGWRNWDVDLTGGPVNFSEALNSDNLPLSGICSGCAASSVQGKASLQFIGPDVTHGMSGYGLTDSNDENAVSGVMALQR